MFFFIVVFLNRHLCTNLNSSYPTLPGLMLDTAHESFRKDIELYVGGQALDGSSDFFHDHLNAFACPDVESNSLAANVLP